MNETATVVDIGINLIMLAAGWGERGFHGCCERSFEDGVVHGKRRMQLVQGNRRGCRLQAYDLPDMQRVREGTWAGWLKCALSRILGPG